MAFTSLLLPACRPIVEGSLGVVSWPSPSDFLDRRVADNRLLPSPSKPRYIPRIILGRRRNLPNMPIDPNLIFFCFADKKPGAEQSGRGEEGQEGEVLGSRETGNISSKKQPLNPFLVIPPEEMGSRKTELKNRNPFEEDQDRLNPFVKDNDVSSANEDEMSMSLDSSSTTLQLALTDGASSDRNASFEDYESVISDIEETLSILSRNSRSTTPVSELAYSSRTPTPSQLGQGFSYSMADLTPRDLAVSDKLVIPVVTVFDDLKDYLSDSDMSLDYKIALQRRRQKNHRNLNKQAQLSCFLTTKKANGQEDGGLAPSPRTDDRPARGSSGEARLIGDPGAALTRWRSRSESSAQRLGQCLPGEAGGPHGGIDNTEAAKHPPEGDMPIRRPGESGSQESDLPTEQGQEKKLTTKRGQESGNQENNSTTRITKEAKCQESDPAARRGGGQEARSGRSPSVPRATSLEPIQEERAGRGEQERLGQGPLAAEGAGCGTPLAQEAGGKGPVRVCVEKWENLFGASTSVERSKRQRTSSLSTGGLGGRQPGAIFHP